MKSNIVLIGMPGCGKSTVGVVLAKSLGMEFLDVDLEIIHRTGRKLQDILDSQGTEAFLDIEADTVCTLRCENTVIATGGSAVLRPRAAEKLKELGTVVYLSLPYEEIVRRIPDLARRGIAFGPGESLKTVYQFRTPIYEALADVTVFPAGGQIPDTVDKIEQALSQR